MENYTVIYTLTYSYNRMEITGRGAVASPWRECDQPV